MTKFTEKKAVLSLCEEIVNRLEKQRTEQNDYINRMIDNHENEPVQDWDSWDKYNYDDAVSTITAIETIVKHLEKLI